MVESQPSKLLVAGSIPVSRSRLSEIFPFFVRRSTFAVREWLSRGRRTQNDEQRTSAKPGFADVAQLAERVLGKDEVSSSILDIGSRDATSVRQGRDFRHIHTTNEA